MKGLRSELRISALQVVATAKSFQEVVDFVVEVEGVKPDEFTMASTSKRFRKGGEFNVLTLEDRFRRLLSSTHSVFTTDCSWGSTSDRSTLL